MNPKCKMARHWLKASTKSEYIAMVDEAKLTPTQEEILCRHILKDNTVTKISISMNISERQVSLALCSSYKKIAEILQKSGGRKKRKNGILSAKG